jgi:UDP-N-acetylglucosamine 2-epimerase (non-hydrolysing)
MENVFTAVRDVLKEVPDAVVVFPVHLNPKVREIAEKTFGGNPSVYLTEPMDYEPFTNLMSRSYLAVTDSGGLQEEAPALGKPVLVIREETERPEGIEAGTARLVGTSYESVKENLYQLLTDEKAYREMAHAVNPYGDGTASKKIVDILIKSFDK